MMYIRELEKTDDVNEVAKIYVSSWKKAYQGIIPQLYLDELNESKWINQLANPEFFSLIAFDKGKMIGTCGFCKSRDQIKADWGEIVSLYILPEHFGKGIGSMLLEAVKNSLRFKGFDKVYLWVLEANDGARRFYEEHGFVSTTEILTSNILGKELDIIKYEKSDGI